MKFNRPMTLLFALASFSILVSDAASATLNRCVGAEKRVEFTDQPCPSGAPARTNRQATVDSSAPTAKNLPSDSTPVLHVIGINEGQIPNRGDGRPLSDRCNGNLNDKQIYPASSPVPVPVAPSSPASVRATPSIDCSIKAEGNVVVNITDSTRPIVLALMAYNKNLWTVKLGKNVRIKKLILAGYHSQRVSGLPIETPVEIYTYDPSPCANCLNGSIHFYSDESPPAQLKEITGLDASSFQGGYKGAEFSIFPGMNIVKSLSKENNWEIKAVQVVKNTAPPPKVVDPQIALDQAVRERVIRKATPEDIKAWRDAYVAKKYTSKNLPVPATEDALSVSKVEIARAYVVLRKFAYPPGMIGENRVVFFIPKGVPEPSGEWGHSAFYDFETLTVGCTAARTGGFGC